MRHAEIVDEYCRNDLHSIFLRDLNPYGFASKSERAIGYSVRDFIDFYRNAFYYILAINRNGYRLVEGYAAIILRKILTPFGVGFVDLQSPTGEGFGVILYNYDGSVYVSDEARMLAEMGDTSFRLGDVNQGYNELMFGDTMQVIAASGCAEAIPGCADCAFVPYCGADPVRNYRTQGDVIGHRPTSRFCERQRALFHFYFDMLERADEDTMRILLDWVMPQPAQ
jgi:hypothetical protein